MNIRRLLLLVFVTALCSGPLVPDTALAQNASPQTRQKKLNVPIRLTDGNRTVTRTRRELGFRLASATGPVAFTVDKGALKDALGRIAKTFRQPAINARPYVYKGRLSLDPGTYARALNVPTTAERLAQAVTQNPATVKFTVSLYKKPPVLTADRLKGITGRLSSYATRATRNAGRNRNIEIAVQAINGTLLSPGETFSLNETVGRRSREKGYKEAIVFVDAEKVPGLGGGVSQVTGTLFNAAALAGIMLREVNPHSRPVSYIPLGRDATVVWGAKDLKFKNDTDTPIYIQYAFQNNQLRATFYGKKTPGMKVTLTPRVQRYAPGKIDAQLYRTFRVNGKVTAKEKVFGHAYRWDATKKS